MPPVREAFWDSFVLPFPYENVDHIQQGDAQDGHEYKKVHGIDPAADIIEDGIADDGSHGKDGQKSFGPVVHKEPSKIGFYKL